MLGRIYCNHLAFSGCIIERFQCEFNKSPKIIISYLYIIYLTILSASSFNLNCEIRFFYWKYSSVTFERQKNLCSSSENLITIISSKIALFIYFNIDLLLIKFRLYSDRCVCLFRTIDLIYWLIEALLYCLLVSCFFLTFIKIYPKNMLHMKQKISWSL